MRWARWMRLTLGPAHTSTRRTHPSDYGYSYDASSQACNYVGRSDGVADPVCENGYFMMPTGCELTRHDAPRAALGSAPAAF